MAKPIMIQGTMSNAGKSVIAAGLCRIFAEDGYRTAPFKSQNMALNSYITKAGLEMGRAQVMQAEAAGVEPNVSMNPILLKPTSDSGSQVIVNGEVRKDMSAKEYYAYKRKLIPEIMQAYQTLNENYDVIVIEGAGSPAEINLKQDDIVNMGMAELADAPVLLIGDIDRGGVFAQLLGTLMLLEEAERVRVKGLLINKFRGDVSILKPGLAMLEDRCGIPVRGVIPYFHLDLEEEDSLSERFAGAGQKHAGAGRIDIAVIRLPRISNYTDFQPLEAREEVCVRYIDEVSQWGNPDAVILPGTKNTMEDLLWLRQSGFEANLIRYAKQNRPVAAICGGYQMLGCQISDPLGVERQGSVRGIGLLPEQTVFAAEKTRTRAEGKVRVQDGIWSGLSEVSYGGYEIHMGETKRTQELAAFGTVSISSAQENGRMESKEDGACLGSVFGTYVHGLFEEEEFLNAFVSCIFRAKGMELPDLRNSISYREYKDRQYGALAALLREHMDIRALYQILERV